jgi:hypothetical protein
MTKRFLPISVLIAGAALTACGGGGVHPSGAAPAAGGASGINQLLTGPHNAAPAAGAVQAHVSVFVPFARQTAATRRRPQYITSYTAGLEIESIQNNVSSGFQFFPLNANAPGCSVADNNAGFTCALTLAAPVGQTQIVVGTFDSATQGSGNLLSIASPTVTIQAGINNVIPITTQPIAAEIVPVTQPPRCVVVGTPVSVSTTYTAYDADGGNLTGLTLGNAISVTNVNAADSPSGYSLSPSTFTMGNGTITFTYNGTDTNVGIFNITSSLAPDLGTNEYVGILGTVPAATAGPHLVYVADSNNQEVLAYDVCANSQQDPLIYTLPAGTNPVEVKFDRSSSALHPRLFVLGGNANGPLVWLDVTNEPGTTLAGSPIYLGSTPHHMQASSAGNYLFLSLGGNTLKQYAINEGTPSLTGTNFTGFSQPRGFNLEGVGDDMLVSNSPAGIGAGSVTAVNPATGAIDATIPGFTNPGPISGPNGPTPSCALVGSSSPAEVTAVSVSTTPSTGAQLIGTPLSVPNNIVSIVFFPPGTPGSGSIGIGSNTALVALLDAPAQLVTCDGSSFSSVAQWSTFMAQPAGMTPSTYASNAISSLIYVTGFDQGQPVVQAFAAAYDHDLGSVALPAGSNPTDITAGP